MVTHYSGTKVLCVAKRKLADHFQIYHNIANVALLLFSCIIYTALPLSRTHTIVAITRGWFMALLFSILLEKVIVEE
jgi:hypothetical protein